MVDAALHRAAEKRLQCRQGADEADAGNYALDCQADGVHALVADDSRHSHSMRRR